jgi:hypothetical protein
VSGGVQVKGRVIYGYESRIPGRLGARIQRCGRQDERNIAIDYSRHTLYDFIEYPKNVQLLQDVCTYRICL